MKRVVIVMLAAVLLVAGCGDDGGLAGEEQELVDAIVDMSMQDADPTNPFSEAEAARCYAEMLVSEFGVERLAELGVTPDTIPEDSEAMFALMTDEEVQVLVDVGLECIDFESLMVDQMIASGLSQESAECYVAELAKTDAFERLMSGSMEQGEAYRPEQDPELLPLMMEAASGCLTAEEMASLSGG
jgi:hypothetical protein